MTCFRFGLPKTKADYSCLAGGKPNAPTNASSVEIGFIVDTLAYKGLALNMRQGGKRSLPLCPNSAGAFHVTVEFGSGFPILNG